MTDRRISRASIYFVLFTALLDVVLASTEISLELVPGTTLLTSCIVGISIGQMALSLIVWMRDLSQWLPVVAATVVSFLFGLCISMHPQGVDIDKSLVILSATLLFGIVPVVIYRVVFVRMNARFSLSILFGLMTVVTVVCAVLIQIDLDWGWFLMYIFFFISSAIPIPLAGFMLVGKRTASIRRYVIIMLSLLLLCAAALVVLQSSMRDIDLVIQISGFMSMYLLVGGIFLLREAKMRTQPVQVESPQAEVDPLAAD
ncbi:hypothetical protein [Bremerella sp.]|uniref:hypothetical protein n=1 Tax=Bremerella sp. TaxID=2795602 RepID=UPI00391CE1E9